MEKVFVNPAPFGEMKYDNFKEVKLLSFPGSKLSSPHNGVVVRSLTPPCENYLKIAHNVDGNIVYSLFCGVTQRFVNNGDKVRKGETIGKFGDDKIMYHIVDDNDKKLQIVKFFESEVEPVKSKKEDGKEKEDEKKKKEETPKSKVKNKEKKGPNIDPDHGMENIGLDLILLPFSALNAVTSKKSDKEKDKKLEEQINRIKNILK